MAERSTARAVQVSDPPLPESSSIIPAVLVILQIPVANTPLSSTARLLFPNKFSLNVIARPRVIVSTVEVSRNDTTVHPVVILEIERRGARLGRV